MAKDDPVLHKMDVGVFLPRVMNQLVAETVDAILPSDDKPGTRIHRYRMKARLYRALEAKCRTAAEELEFLADSAGTSPSP